MTIGSDDVINYIRRTYRNNPVAEEILTDSIVEVMQRRDFRIVVDNREGGDPAETFFGFLPRFFNLRDSGM